MLERFGRLNVKNKWIKLDTDSIDPKTALRLVEKGKSDRSNPQGRINSGHEINLVDNDNEYIAYM